MPEEHGGVGVHGRDAPRAGCRIDPEVLPLALLVSRSGGVVAAIDESGDVVRDGREVGQRVLGIPGIGGTHRRVQGLADVLSGLDTVCVDLGAEISEVTREASLPVGVFSSVERCPCRTDRGRVVVVDVRDRSPYLAVEISCTGSLRRHEVGPEGRECLLVRLGELVLCRPGSVDRSAGSVNHGLGRHVVQALARFSSRQLRRSKTLSGLLSSERQDERRGDGACRTVTTTAGNHQCRRQNCGRHYLPCLALPCLALPCLALPCLALPCLASCHDQKRILQVLRFGHARTCRCQHLTPTSAQMATPPPKAVLVLPPWDACPAALARAYVTRVPDRQEVRVAWRS